MANNKTTYLENRILNHLLRNTASSAPATVYLALFTSDPGEAGGGSEVAGGSYAREAIAFNAASGGSCASSSDVLFEDLPAATITHVAIMDAATSGNMFYYGALTSSIPSSAGSDLTFTAGSITVEEQ